MATCHYKGASYWLGIGMQQKNYRNSNKKFFKAKTGPESANSRGM